MARARTTTLTATFHGATRAKSSPNGNPSWVLHTSEGDFRTEPDGSVGYAVNNYTGGPDSLIDKRVTLHMTGARRYVWNIEPVSE